MEAKIKIKNYKLHNDLEVEMKGGNLYFVKGPNNVGKTSFVQALMDLINGTSTNKQKLSFNERSGYVSGTFNLNGADGEVYQVIMDYAQGKSDKFTIIKPDGTKSNKKTEIADIFKYNEFTVEEFFAWGETAEGRRKQAAIFMQLLPEQDVIRINNIDSMINANNGTIFLERKDLNRDAKRIQSAVDINLLSPFESDVAKKGVEWIKEYNDIKIKYDEALIEERSIDAIVKSNEYLKQSVDNCTEDLKSITDRYDDEISNTEDHIAELERKINDLKTKLQSSKINKEKSVELAKEKLANAERKLKDEYKEVKEVNVIELREALNRKQEAVDTYNEVMEKVKRKNTYINELAKIKDSIKDKEMDIEKMSNERTEIIERGMSSNGRIFLHDGELLYKTNENVLVPFSSKNVSYSEAGMIIFDLMTRINNKLKLWVIGKASEYDNEKIKAMLQIAIEKDGIIVADEVDRDETEFKIEVFDETNK